MSKGKITKPRNPEIPDNLYRKPLEDAIYYVIQTCEVEVENSEWQEADKKLKEEITVLDAKAKEIDKRLGDNSGNLSEEIKALKLEIEDLKSRKPLDLVVNVGSAKKQDLGIQHQQLPLLIQILSARLNVYLVGPAGSGKTHAAIQCAKALGVEFHFTGAVASEFKLTGFIDAQGRIVSTEFRKAYEHGGLFLFDEIDASYPQAVLAFNAALANDYMDFPDQRVERHKDFYCIAAANTYGQGADRQYVGRNQLDAASLDRFVFVDWNYDENLERQLAGNLDWSDYVQKVRKCTLKLKIRHVVSPRASIYGAQLLSQGLQKEKVEELVLWKGLDLAVKEKVIASVGPKEIRADRDGTFKPSVKPNQMIRKGDSIGEIIFRHSLYYGEDSKEIESEIEGIAIQIIEEGAVSKGDLLATIQD